MQPYKIFLLLCCVRKLLPLSAQKLNNNNFLLIILIYQNNHYYVHLKCLKFKNMFSSMIKNVHYSFQSVKLKNRIQKKKCQWLRRWLSEKPRSKFLVFCWRIRFLVPLMHAMADLKRANDKQHLIQVNVAAYSEFRLIDSNSAILL